MLKIDNDMENKNVIVFILSFIILATVGIIFVSQKGAQPAPAVSVPNPTPQASNIPADWKTYRNERMGFALRYPGDWIINDHLSELDIETGTIVYFQMPKTLSAFLLLIHPIWPNCNLMWMPWHFIKQPYSLNLIRI